MTDTPKIDDGLLEARKSILQDVATWAQVDTAVVRNQPGPQVEALAVRKAMMDKRLAELLADSEAREKYVADLEAEVVVLRKEPKL